MTNRHPLALPLLLLSSLANAQPQLNSVTFNPTNPTECNLVDLVLHGTMPTSGSFTQFVPPPPDNDSLLLIVYAEGGTNGSSNYNQSLPGLGPFAPGTYTFCANFYYNNNLADTWCTTLTIAPGVDPDAGEFNDTIVCNSGPDFPLISILLGTPDPGGTWYDPFNQPVGNGQFDPGQSPEGPYSYIFDVQPPCQDAFQQIVITYTPNSQAGLNGSADVCSSGAGADIDLFAQLNGTPDAGGTWTFNGAPHGGIFDPSTDDCGVYTYTVPGIPPCGDPSSTVTITCVNPPNAGTGGQTVNLCYNDTSEVLNNYITGEPQTGYWIDQGGFFIGAYNAHLNVSNVGSGQYGYVVEGSICPNDTAFVTVVLWGDSIQGCTIGVDEVGNEPARFELAPNPAGPEVDLDLAFDQFVSTVLLDLLDVNGAVVRNWTFNANGPALHRALQVEDLPRGAYLLRVRTDANNAVRRLMLR